MTTTSSDSGALGLRNNFIKAITHQISLAGNADYTFKGAGGVDIKPRRWWTEKAGQCNLYLRCGAARIDSDNPITCERENLVTVLNGVRRDAEDGVLDSILVTAAERVIAKRRNTIAMKAGRSPDTAVDEKPSAAKKAEKKKSVKDKKKGKPTGKPKKEAMMAKSDKKVKKEKKAKKKDKKKAEKKKNKKKGKKKK